MKLIKNIWPVLILVGIELILFATNYTPGTYLIGWDNVMPEFNIALNFKRAIFSVWQDYRGLGLTDGMAHAANLLHTTYIMLLSFVLPQNMLRYTFLTLTHLAGGIGMYFLLRHLTEKLKTDKPDSENRELKTENRNSLPAVALAKEGQLSTLNSQLIPLAGALFYMFNIGVIQMYFAPLEVFSVHFAALPLLTLFILRTLEKTNIKNLALLFMAAFLVSPQGFVPTVFGAFLILFLALLAFDFLAHKNIKKVLIIAFVVFAANAFWFLPYTYTALHTSKTIPNTRINQFSSEEIYLRNKSRGDIASVLTLKGFMIDSIEYDNTNNHDVFFMNTWRVYYSKPIPVIISILFAFLALFGIYKTIRTKQKILYPFVVGFAASFFFLANNTPVLTQLSDLIRLVFPLVGEALRFPFTKFIILFAFSFSIFLTIGITYISTVLEKRIKNHESRIMKLSHYSLFIILSSALLAISLPAFLGNFYSPLLRIPLPNEYQQLFSYLSTQNTDGRIANLPAFTFWNWQYRSWGHIGSGFDWYATAQPILERSFDPWSLYNEQFYNEFSYAINRNDKDLFKSVIKKYDIAYLVLDKSVVNSLTRGGINYPTLQDFVTSNPNIIKATQFKDIVVYKVADANSASYLLPKETPKLPSGAIFENEDNSYLTFGNYVASSKPDDVFVIPATYTNKLQSDLTFTAVEDHDHITLEPKNSFANLNITKNSVLELPSMYFNEDIIPVEAKVNGVELVISPLYPKIIINNNTYQPEEQKILANTVTLDNPTSVEFVDTQSAQALKNGTARGFIFNNYLNVIRIKDEKGNQQLVAIDTRNVDKPTFLLPLNETSINSIKIVFDKIPSTLNIENVIQKKKYHVNISPDSLKVFNNSHATSTTLPDGVKLEAVGDASADLSYYASNLPHFGTYMLSVDADYGSGLPVNFYVENPQENKAESETKLSKTNENNVLVLPKTEDVFSGYGIHLIVKSQSEERARSVIKNISLYPAPLATINNIKILLNGSIATSNIAAENLQPKKINASLYTVMVPGDSNGKYIVLSQSYDPGWHAYRIMNHESRIMNYLTSALPFLFGKELNQHTTVNGWANGWLVDNSQLATDNSQLIIVYFPQYLEYIGFAIMLMTGLILVAKMIKGIKSIMT